MPDSLKGAGGKGRPQGFNEMGEVVKFTRNALGCRTLNELAEFIIISLYACQSTCHVQLRGSRAAGTLTLTPGGFATSLEESVIEHMSSEGSFFQFKSRMILNCRNVSLLITNMPGEDDARAGGIRDYALMIAAAADDAVESISLRADAVERALELQRLAESGRRRVEKLEESARTQQMNTRLALELLVERIEAMYYQFGLSTRQEETISESVRATRDEVLGLFDRFENDFDRQFVSILDDLNRVSSL